MTSRQPRNLETLISQAMLMQEIDRRAGGNVMVQGWIEDLLPEERELFDRWLTETIQPIVEQFSSWLDVVGKGFFDGLVSGFTVNPVYVPDPNNPGEFKIVGTIK